MDQVDDCTKFAPLSAMTPMERLAYSLDKLGDVSLIGEYEVFLDNYEEFLAAKSHAELESVQPGDANHFRNSAQQFDDFLHAVFVSDYLDRKLVRYLLI